MTPTDDKTTIMFEITHDPKDHLKGFVSVMAKPGNPSKYDWILVAKAAVTAALAESGLTKEELLDYIFKTALTSIYDHRKDNQGGQA